MKILVLRLGAIGDIIRTMPAVKYINENVFKGKAEIHWIAESHNSVILEGLPYVHKVISLPRKEWQKKFFSFSIFKTVSEIRNLIKNLRKENYDIAVDFHGIFKSGLLSHLSKAKLRLGYDKKNCKELNHFFNNKHIIPLNNRINRYKKIFALTSYFDEKSELTESLFDNLFGISVTDKKNVDPFISVILRTTGFESPTIIGIQPSVSLFGRNKEWPEKNYSELCSSIIKKIHNSIIVFNWWGDNEYEKVGRIINSVILTAEEKKRFFLMPSFSFRERAYFFSKLSAFITPDTGPMYIASSAGTNVLALFGPSDPELYAPFGNHYYIVKENIECSPCRKRSCKKLLCMSLIRPDAVLNKLKEILKNN